MKEKSDFQAAEYVASEKKYSMDLNLKNKTALVCGSTQGLGFASAKELALLGANIILMARNETKLKEVVQLLDVSKGQQHQYLVADFSSVENVQSAIEGFDLETTPVHILVNNTGGPAGGKLIDAELSAFSQTFESHLLCNHVLTKAVVPGMKLAGFGRIINIISTSVKSPIPGLGVSNTIRGSVANWSKTLAGELGGMGITVNNVLPGFTNTSRAAYVIENKTKASGKSSDDVMKELLAEIPAGRIGEPDEFGSVVAFLCSPSAGYINGINLPVDGGRLACL